MVWIPQPSSNHHLWRQRQSPPGLLLQHRSSFLWPECPKGPAISGFQHTDWKRAIQTFGRRWTAWFFPCSTYFGERSWWVLTHTQFFCFQFCFLMFLVGSQVYDDFHRRQQKQGGHLGTLAEMRFPESSPVSQPVLVCSKSRWGFPGVWKTHMEKTVWCPSTSANSSLGWIDQPAWPQRNHFGRLL